MAEQAADSLSPSEKRVLLLPPTRRDAEAIERFLRDAEIPFFACSSMGELCAETGRGAGAVLVAEEALTADPEAYAAFMQEQEVWSDLSTIVLARAGIEPPKLAAVLPRIGNVSVVERPMRITTLLSLVRSALRGRERQYQVRAYLTEQERIERRLRTSEERLRLAVQTGRLGVWELDLQENKLTCTAICKANFGRRADDPFEYEDFWAAVHPDDAPRVREALRACLEEGIDYDTEYRTVWLDGSVHWALARGRPMLAIDRRPIRLIGVTLDISARKAAEAERAALLESERAARTSAERAGRMKDEFLATLSHELRTPLNAILGWSQVLRLKKHDEESLAEGLRTIERNARAQTQIIEDLLDMSRIISGKVRLDIQRIDLASVIEAAVETVRPAADAKGIRLQVVLDSSDGPVGGDPNRLQQVFWNLISNAVKFTPRDQRIQVVLERVNSHFEARVIDTGEGIASDFLPHVFDRFRQADASSSRQHGGLGLGLAIVKQLVELHGGSVRADSPGPGLGATFTVCLPLMAVHADPDGGKEEREVRPERGAIDGAHAGEIEGVRILVVDDEPDSRGLLKRLLEDCKAQVTVAGSAREALAALQAVRPDVLISDIGMPGEDGYSLIRKVRALEPQQGGATPAAALTAYARAEDRVRTMKAGFQHHVAKPVEPAELIAVVASLAGRDGAGRS